MRDGAIDLQGDDQLFDFVHVNDVVASFMKAVAKLDSFGRKVKVKEDFLICSGESHAALQVLQHVKEFSRSSSLTRRTQARVPWQ